MKTLNSSEIQYLRELCACETGKGIIVHKQDKKIVANLVRKGFAWTLSSVFTVCIASDSGRDLLLGLSDQSKA